MLREGQKWSDPKHEVKSRIAAWEHSGRIPLDARFFCLENQTLPGIKERNVSNFCRLWIVAVRSHGSLVMMEKLLTIWNLRCYKPRIPSFKSEMFLPKLHWEAFHFLGACRCIVSMLLMEAKELPTREALEGFMNEVSKLGFVSFSQIHSV